jgi:hypothetical protein
LDLPVAGRGYSADSVKTIFDLKHLNGVPGRPQSKKKRPDGAKQDEDIDGSGTVRYLKVVKRATSRVFGPHPSSLGLHPGVYCYGATGRFQPTAFLAAVVFVNELKENRAFPEFTNVRLSFEDFLLRYRHFINLIGRHLGGGKKGLNAALILYRMVLVGIREKLDDKAIIKNFKVIRRFHLLQR